MTTPLEPSYCLIPLTQGKMTKVDPEDYEQLSKFKWYAWKNRINGDFYARRNISHKDSSGIRGIEYMHRQIMGLTKGDRIEVDHAFHDTLDNRKFIGGRANLRKCTHQQNIQNHKKTQKNRSGYKGVTFDKRKGMYFARIRSKFLGYKQCPKEAHELYVNAAKELYGDFAFNSAALERH